MDGHPQGEGLKAELVITRSSFAELFGTLPLFFRWLHFHQP